MGARRRSVVALSLNDFSRHLSDCLVQYWCKVSLEALWLMRLVLQGAGPVHLIGQHLLGALVEEFEDMEEMEEEMLDEEEGDDSQFKVSDGV